MFREIMRIARVLARVLRLMSRGHLAALATTLLFLIGIGALSNVPAVVTGKLVDHLDAPDIGELDELLLTVVIALVGAVIVREGFQVVRKLTVENACTKSEKFVRVEAVKRLLEVDLHFFRHRLSGAVQGRLNRSIEGLVRLVKLFFLDLGPTAFVALAAVGIAIYRCPGMGVLMASVIPTGLLLVMCQIKNQAGIRVSLLRGKEAIDGTVVELLGNIESVRAIHAIEYEADRVKAVSEDLRRIEMKHHFAMALFDTAKQLNEVVFHALVLGLSIYLSIVGDFTTGDVVTFSMLFGGVVAPLREIHRIIDEAHESTICVDDLFEILDQKRDRSFLASVASSDTVPGGVRHSRADQKRLPYAISLSDFSYRYPGEETDVLRDIGFSVAEGEFVGVCGPAGCGKSTLLKAILRLIHSTPGSIALRGRPIEMWSREELANDVSFVGQKPFIVDGTIKDNIAYGLSDLSEERIVEAAKLANIHDEVTRLPGGYQYRVGEGGLAISGGQRQRIALARVFLRSPTVLLLDEATSALDNINERIVQSAIERAMVGRTVVAVAHRLSTLRNADRIVVLDRGLLAEVGTYTELVRASGLFSRLVSAGDGSECEDEVRRNYQQSLPHLRTGSKSGNFESTL